MANNVNIVINAQDKASHALGRVSDKAKSMRGQFLAMTAIGGAVTGALGMMTKSALDQEIGVRKLDSALKNVNSSYESQAVVIEKTLRALQDKTNFGDEEQREALTALIRLTGDYEGSLKALPVTMDLAVGANMDFKGATQLMGKVLSGQTSALSRYGITLDKNATQTEILAKLTEQFGGAAESAFDPINAMQNELGDLGQEIGDVLLPLFISFMEKIIPIIKSVVEWADKNPALMKTIVLVTGALGGLLVFLGLLGLAIPPIIAGIGLMTGAWTALTVAMYSNPVGLIVIALAALVLALFTVVKIIIKIVENWDKLVEKFKQGINALVGPINALINVFNAMTGAQLDHLEKFELATDRIAEKTKALGDTSAESYKDVWRSAEAMNQSLDETNQSFNVANTSIGEIDESMKKLNETTKKSIALTEEQSELLMRYASSRRKWAEISNIEIENFAFENTVNLAYKQVQLEQETVEKKKEINKKYLDTYFDMYEESQKKIVEVVNKAHLEMESMEETLQRKREEANEKAQLDESTIPGLSNLPAFGTVGRSADHVNAIMSANLSGGLRKASGEMMTSAEMREFLGIKLSKTGEIPTIGGTGIPVHEVNINVSPELDAQINFNRVGDTLRQKQGDYTSGIGNL